MFNITRAGRTALLDSNNKAIKIELATASFGSGRYNSTNNDPRTSLQTPLLSSPLVVRSTDVNTGRMQFVANLRTSTATPIYEVGLFTPTGILFAIDSNSTTPLFTTTPNVTHTITFTIQT